MSTVCSRCEHQNPGGANFCEQCRAPLRPTRPQQEDPVDRLARRVAEENDRLARKRQDEWISAKPIFPKWFIWIGWAAGAYIVFLVIYLVFILH